MNVSTSIIYLIPCYLDEGSIDSIPDYVSGIIEECEVFFVEEERTARRFLKKIRKEFKIAEHEWFKIDKHAGDGKNMKEDYIVAFRKKLKEGKKIGIISEAGSPGIADPGQELVAIAHAEGAKVKPLAGPSAILLALMASGMNGQHFQFVGYLPIDEMEKIKWLKQLEKESASKNCTQIFIETPYRNNQLIQSILKTCKENTLLCIAANLTGSNEYIKTKSISAWKKAAPDLHKQPAIFCLIAGK